MGRVASDNPSASLPNLSKFLNKYVEVFGDEQFNPQSLLKYYTGTRNEESDPKHRITNGTAIEKQQNGLSNNHAGDDEAPIVLLDINDLLQKVETWIRLLPRVQPFYAVKCNPHEMVINILSNAMQLISPEVAEQAQFNNIGFDCASKAEINAVVNKAEIAPERIIFAHTCKPSSHLQYARAHEVRMMTFDSELELEKIRDVYPEASLVLRLRVRDTGAGNPLGIKFGCETQQIRPLLTAAKQMGLNVIGICFHVGSRATDKTVYWDAIQLSREAFDIGKDMGLEFTFFNIGGGFPGQEGGPLLFTTIAEIVNAALDKFFPARDFAHVRISSEPGRYFVASAFTLLTKVLGKKFPHENASNKIMYYVNDGVYGSFNGRIITKDPLIVPNVSLITENNEEKHCSIWGPTCDGRDQLFDDIVLPEQKIGDWLIFPNMGAYTTAVGSEFNGFPRPVVKSVCNSSTWDAILSRIN